ncbi:hypothetical protein [Larkinella terrae]|uniref:Uncharacterized protein n=1 Tax=Larkinella terrae TaxID=2025311 RepID=A0A7K0ELN3_9BACT|nr:hypothetical protein [Larkinella terrae]MRS62441.1 hypothetical protein [Larkinella terrae]
MPTNDRPYFMIAKPGSSEDFDFGEVNRFQANTSSHRMAKYRKNKPYKLSLSKTILWSSILLIAVGFLFLWFKLIEKLIGLFMQ